MTIYQSSKGPVEISTMVLSYAKNASSKLKRNEPERTTEIQAIDAHIAVLEAEATAKALAGDEHTPKMGDNNPPADEPAPAVAISGRAAIELHVTDLIADVQGLCLVIETEDQANVVSRLHRQLQQAVALVDTTATEEKRPHNDALTEIGAWQNGFTAKGLKKTPDGSLTKALHATTNLSTAWLRKQDDARREREAEAAKIALAAVQEAVVAREEAKTSTDLDKIDSAQDSMAQAKALMRQAEGISKEKVRVGGGEGVRAMGLRSYWLAQPTGEDKCWNQALAHFVANPEFKVELQALIQRWADRAASTEAGRAIGVPGFRIVEDRRAA